MNLQNHRLNDSENVILPIGFGDFQNLCFPFGPPKLCFPSLYRKNVFYYCATFIRGHRRYQKEGILCALSIFSGDLLDILIRQAPKSKPHWYIGSRLGQFCVQEWDMAPKSWTLSCIFCL